VACGAADVATESMAMATRSLMAARGVGPPPFYAKRSLFRSM
jgi:hypothetical protein